MTSLRILSLLVITLLPCIGVRASSVIQLDLSSVNAVKLQISIGLHFDPIPGLDLESLEARIREIVSSTLVGSDIVVDDHSALTLIVSVNKKKVPCSETEHYALLEIVELLEPAVLGRAAGGESKGKSTFVINWLDSTLFVSSRDTLEEDLLEEVEWSVKGFTGAVKAARAFVKEQSSQPEDLAQPQQCPVQPAHGGVPSSPPGAE